MEKYLDSELVISMMKYKGISESELAKMLDVNEQMIKNWLKGREHNLLLVKTIYELATILDLPHRELLTL